MQRRMIEGEHAVYPEIDPHALPGFGADASFTTNRRSDRREAEV
jgi:hypothetical protein